MKQSLTEKVKSKASYYFNESIIPGLFLGTIMGAGYVACAMAWVAATLAVNTAYYTLKAGCEGVERIVGVSPTNQVFRLKEKKVALGPNGYSTPYGIFETQDGKEMVIIDAPVITSGKILPGTLESMSEGKTYDVKTFGWLAHSMIDAKEVN